jgi:hypothetical protein
MGNILSFFRMNRDDEPPPNETAPKTCCRRPVGRAFLQFLCRQDAGSTLRFMESLVSLLRMHWDHGPECGTSLVWCPAFRRSGPAEAGTPNGRFMERWKRPQGRAPRRSVLFASAGLVFFLCLAGTARAQEAIRMSMAGEEAARAHRQAASTVGYYNLTVGPTLWKFGAGLQLEYTDNVSLGTGGSESDFSFRPQINSQMLWPITDKNSLNLDVGVGYSAYVKHSDLDRVFITPGSGLSFDLYVGDVWINLHDRFSITEDAYEDPTAVTGDYARL